ASRERRQGTQVRVHPACARGLAEDHLARIEVLKQLAVEEVGVARDELLKAARPPALHVHRYAPQPRDRDRGVILPVSSVPSSDVTNRRDHDALCLLDRMQTQIGPRELEMLSMPEAATGPNDLVKDSDVGSPHTPTLAAAAGRLNSGQHGGHRGRARPGDAHGATPGTARR